MKRCILVILATATLAVAHAQEKKRWDDGLTAEERVMKRQLLMRKRTGGYIDQRMPGSGKFIFVNAQNIAPTSAYEAQLPIISDVFAVEVTNCVYGADINFVNAASVLQELGGNAGVFVVNQKDAPALYIAPEKGWAFVNVAALSVDSPDEKLLAKRVRREVWRGFAMAAGSTDTEWDHCLLGPITSLKALDTIDSEAVSPEPTTKIAKHLTKLGILPFKRVTYKQACQEGWAPAPKDDFQQAIWDKVKAEQAQVPTKPLRITPDMKPQGK